MALENDDLSQTDEWEEMLVMDSESLFSFHRRNEKATKIYENEQFWTERSNILKLAKKHDHTSWCEHVVWQGRIFEFGIILLESQPNDDVFETYLEKIFKVDENGLVSTKVPSCDSIGVVRYTHKVEGVTIGGVIIFEDQVNIDQISHLFDGFCDLCLVEKIEIRKV